MKGFGSIESVLAAIREDARAEIERIESDAAAAVARLRDEDARSPFVVADADVRLAAARRQARERLAEQDWADRQEALNAREAWIARIAAEGQRRSLASEPGVRRRGLLRLAREAVERIGGDDVELLISAADAAVADSAWQSQLANETGRTISLTPAVDIASAGCIARTRDGRLSYDNTYVARARRFESSWRAVVAGLFEQASESPVGAGAAQR